MMSIHVCKCTHNGREEFHLRYPGMPERAALELASTINGSKFESDLARLHKENADLRAKLGSDRMNLNHDRLNGYAPIKITLPDGELIVLDSFIDDQGVRRFVPNVIIDQGHDDRLFDLNTIAMWCFRNNVPIKDRIHFWAMLGYSVSGLSGMSNILPMDKCRVETPEWSGGPFDDDGNEVDVGS